jgi:hypothetical protein
VVEDESLKRFRRRNEEREEPIGCEGTSGRRQGRRRRDAEGSEERKFGGSEGEREEGLEVLRDG